MIRIDAEALTDAAQAVAIVMRSATDARGLRIAWPSNRRLLEKHICAMLSAMSPASGPDAVIPNDVGEYSLGPNGFHEAVLRPLRASPDPVNDGKSGP